ncbi:hypothetical protein [Phyllobacterium leguminum]|uniref:Uncharacterized protein n=1 Tax=Phyllobacterium leguminum TaxID=314237 RepID=A0A318T5P6_9HYPH|nr:hypothetical protein [Phyllobacterium leguminum]PYE89635.1 hypothetical protein C7477_103143 [Phyllobacterium leguminum]
MIWTSVFNITSIELVADYADHQHRRVRITAEGGGELELNLYGKTDALALLPKSKDFISHNKPLNAAPVLGMQLEAAE